MPFYGILFTNKIYKHIYKIRTRYIQNNRRRLAGRPGPGGPAQARGRARAGPGPRQVQPAHWAGPASRRRIHFGVQNAATGFQCRVPPSGAPYTGGPVASFWRQILASLYIYLGFCLHMIASSCMLPLLCSEFHLRFFAPCSELNAGASFSF